MMHHHRRPVAHKDMVAPQGILGPANCAGVWHWDGATESSGALIGVPNMTGNGNLGDVGASGERPAPSTLLGRRAGLGDGSDDGMLATLTTIIASGQRPYIWIVGQAVSLGTGVRYGGTCWATAAAGAFSFLRFDGGSGKDTCLLTCTDGTDTVVGPNTDSNPHLWEAGHLSGTAARFVRDGVAFAGIRTGASTQEQARFVVHGLRPVVTGFETGTKFQSAVLSGGIEPTVEQRRWIRDYFRRRNYGLSIA